MAIAILIIEDITYDNFEIDPMKTLLRNISSNSYGPDPFEHFTQIWDGKI